MENGQHAAPPTTPSPCTTPSSNNNNPQQRQYYYFHCCCWCCWRTANISWYSSSLDVYNLAQLLQIALDAKFSKAEENASIQVAALVGAATSAAATDVAGVQQRATSTGRRP